MSMKRSTDHIRTTCTGSSPPRPQEIFDLVRRMTAGETVDPKAYEAALEKHIGDFVRCQVEAGIDVVTDGELSKAELPGLCRRAAPQAGSWALRSANGWYASADRPDGRRRRRCRGVSRIFTRSRVGEQSVSSQHHPRWAPRICVGPVRYVGQEKLQRDIRNLKNAMAKAGADEGFMPSLTPVPAMPNEYYKTEEEFSLAFGEAMREEYKAILDAGAACCCRSTSRASSAIGMSRRRRPILLAIASRSRLRHRAAQSRAARPARGSDLRFHTCYGVNFRAARQ